MKWRFHVGDLGVKLIALKCKKIKSLDISYLPITENNLKFVLQLQDLDDLVLRDAMALMKMAFQHSSKVASR